MTTEPAIHLGRNIKRLREMLHIKQEALAITLGEDWSQKKVSRLEERETVEDELLKQVAGALHVTPEAIKNYNEENIVFSIQNMHDNSQAIYHYNFNPLDKYIEQVEENKRLYEALLKEKDEKIVLLEKLMNK